MVLKAQPGTRDEKFGGSWYCENPICQYREWQNPAFVPPVSESERPPDWKIEEYENRKATGPTYAQITPQVFLGDLIDAWLIRDRGGKPFDAILNVSQKQYDSPPGVEYVQIPLTEYGSKPGKRNRRDRDFARAVQQLEAWVAQGKTVFVHCVAGANRSASVVMAYLADQGEDLPSAMQTVQSQRPVAWPHGEIALTLRRYLKSKAEASVAMTGDDPSPLQPTGKRAADAAAEFVSQADWAKTFETNYLHIEMSDATLEEYDPADPFFEPQTTSSERFVRTDVLISQALGGQEQEFAMAAQREAALPRKKKDTRTRSLFKSDKPELIPPEEHPARAIKRLPPEQAAKELLSRRGLKLPAPEVFNSDRYQYVYSKAPLIPLNPKDPRTIEKCLAFLERTPGLLIGQKEDMAGQYYLCPTKFGSKKIDHVMYASWFAIFSANTAVESEETSFVLWQAGASGKAPGKPGIMSKKPKIKEWLQFMKWAGFPTFKNLYKTLEGFDTSDESYARRLTALSRLPGMQMKVASFFLALLGDVRSPTLDMHALGYLISKGEIQVPEGKQWTDLSVIAELAREMKEINRDIGTNNYEYRAKRTQYDELAEQNKETVARLMGGLKIKSEPPPTPKGMEGERKKVQEYMRRQLAGWDGKTNTFWLWYAQNMYFETHEPRRDMIHTVFFQSLFPELFTPEALASRDELFKKYSDPELVEEREQRMKYRDFAENLEQMRKIQPHKQKGEPGSSEDFDWETGTPQAPNVAPRAPEPKYRAVTCPSCKGKRFVQTSWQYKDRVKGDLCPQCDGRGQVVEAA